MNKNKNCVKITGEKTVITSIIGKLLYLLKYIIYLGKDTSEFLQKESSWKLKLWKQKQKLKSWEAKLRYILEVEANNGDGSWERKEKKFRE